MKSKLATPAELARVSEEMRSQGRCLVFTNGCFDLLHVGHTRYLQQARAMGDALVVAVNGDVSVRTLKGPTRPINSEDERAEVLAALACVDYVVLFHEARVDAVIRAVRPQLYVKGGDYTLETLHPEEVAALREAKSELRILPLVPGKSTTATLRRSQC